MQPSQSRYNEAIDPNSDANRVASISIEQLHRELTQKQQTVAEHVKAKLGPINIPRKPEDKIILPVDRLHHFLETVCGSSLQASSEVEKALKVLSGEYIHGAIAFAVSMARRRGTWQGDLLASDIDLFMQQQWGLKIPGLSHGKIATYRRLAGNDAHRTRMKAVRRGNGGDFLKAIPVDKKRSNTDAKRRMDKQHEPEEQRHIVAENILTGRDDEGLEEEEEEDDEEREISERTEHVPADNMAIAGAGEADYDDYEDNVESIQERELERQAADDDHGDDNDGEEMEEQEEEEEEEEEDMPDL